MHSSKILVSHNPFKVKPAASIILDSITQGSPVKINKVKILIVKKIFPSIILFLFPILSTIETAGI